MADACQIVVHGDKQLVVAFLARVGGAGVLLKTLPRICAITGIEKGVCAGVVAICRSTSNGGVASTLFCDPECEFLGLLTCQLDAEVLAEWLRQGRRAGTGEEFCAWSNARLPLINAWKLGRKQACVLSFCHYLARHDADVRAAGPWAAPVLAAGPVVAGPAARAPTPGPCAPAAMAEALADNASAAILASSTARLPAQRKRSRSPGPVTGSATRRRAPPPGCSPHEGKSGSPGIVRSRRSTHAPPLPPPSPRQPLRAPMPLQWDASAFLAHASRAQAQRSHPEAPLETDARRYETHACAVLADAVRTFMSDSERASLGVPPSVEDAAAERLAAALFACARMAGPKRMPSAGVPLVTAVVDARLALERVSDGWASEMGAMLLPSDQKSALERAGLRVPPWRCFADVAAQLAKHAKLNVASLCGKMYSRQGVPAAKVLARFTMDAALRNGAVISSITEITGAEFVSSEPASASSASGSNARVAFSMPAALEAARASFLWWPKVEAFLLLSMGGSSMSFHLDLWATAVFYHILWGGKVFALAPPTERNIELLQRWQCEGEPDDGELSDGSVFPADLQHLSSAVLSGGFSILIPAGWIHAVFTPADSCALGWNFHTAAQLGTSLPLALSDWGARTAEMRQVPAFDLQTLRERLWALVETVVERLDTADMADARNAPVIGDAGARAPDSAESDEPGGGVDGVGLPLSATAARARALAASLARARARKLRVERLIADGLFYGQESIARGMLAVADFLTLHGGPKRASFAKLLLKLRLRAAQACADVASHADGAQAIALDGNVAGARARDEHGTHAPDGARMAAVRLMTPVECTFKPVECGGLPSPNPPAHARPSAPMCRAMPGAEGGVG